ncbi:hypothetical protein POM88_022241 [Heracleum sosnowskyi]|uniref:Uncharacterized protein n=1 Tax=Heracleum sosnowskyi TaxID=360622 RepID=A0AAD8IGG7_9APIA|nr:hypothetical protein POM88_022241 [Heracleum sosnowskyi]
MNSEEEEAALILCSMKNSKVDSTTSLQLEETRVSILKKHKLQHPSSLSPLSNNTRLLSLVPPSLAEVIGDCSTPFDKRLTGSDIQENQGVLVRRVEPTSGASKVLKEKIKTLIEDRGCETTVWGCETTVCETTVWSEATPVVE